VSIRAIIVDDEEFARDEMRFLLGGVEEVEVVGEATGGAEAVHMVEELGPDLMFLDIQMPVMNGFQVIEMLLDAADTMPLVIFTTAYDKYAIRAFEVNAVDYLLKPIEMERLRSAIERAGDLLPRREEYIERIRKLTSNIKVGTRFLPRIVVQKGDDVELVEVEQVAMIYREGTKICAHTASGDYVTNYRDLDELEVQLDPRIFQRLGSDHLVNLRRILQIVPWSGGNYIMVLDDAGRTEVRLSRSQSQLLKNKVEGIF
jgi:DNA-binding LytR/AlgR family response regulator